VNQAPFRVSVSSGTLYHWPLGRFFILASGLEIDGVELVIGPECVLRGAPAVRALAARHGVRILSLHPPVLPLPGWTGLVICAGKLAEWAARLNAPLVTLHTPRLTSLDSEAGQRYLALAHGLAKRLQAGGSQLALENRARYSKSNGAECLDRPGDLLALAQEWRAGITFDTAHAGTTSSDILADFAVLCPAVVNVHFSDLALPWRWPTPSWMETVLQHHQVPGTGTLPLRQLAAALGSEQYAGLVTLELSPLSPGLLGPNRARRTLSGCVAFVRGNSTHALGTTSDSTR
jgi:sugar phosphate isomerase/epimerase